jgi:hypothetical protein
MIRKRGMAKVQVGQRSGAAQKRESAAPQSCIIIVLKQTLK